MVCFAGQIAFDCGVVRHGSLLSTRSVLISRTKMYFRQVTVFTLLLVCLSRLSEAQDCSLPGNQALFTCIMARLRGDVTPAPTRVSTAAARLTTLANRPTNERNEPANIKTIRREFRQLLSRNKDLIAAWVQLGFHSCVGGCNGCLNTESPHNKGLIGTYRDIRALQRKHADVLDLADFIALAAIEAVKAGIKNSIQIDVPIRFRIGRRTCANPDKPNKEAHFPEGNDPHAVNILVTDFRLSRQEAVVLLGAHSLGKCTAANTGFDGPWDFSPEKLDNAYFRSMTGTRWVAGPSPGGVTQWNSPDGSRMMLHADLGLLKSFGVSGREKFPSCPTSVGCPAARDARLVRDYSRDQVKFHRDFVPAFEKMVENTRDRLRNP